MTAGTVTVLLNRQVSAVSWEKKKKVFFAVLLVDMGHFWMAGQKAELEEGRSQHVCQSVKQFSLIRANWIV